MLGLFAHVRKRVEANDLTIDWRHEIIASLEEKRLQRTRPAWHWTGWWQYAKWISQRWNGFLEMELATSFGRDVVSVSEAGTKGLEQG